MNKTEVEAFVLTEDDLKGETEDYFYFSLITIITIIPLVISIFLFLYKIIKLSRIKKTFSQPITMRGRNLIMYLRLPLVN